MRTMYFLAVIACTLAADPSGHIAYVSGESLERAIYVLDVASGESVKVSPGRNDGNPRWSPDGEWLAFESDFDGGRSISLVRPDGSEGQYVTHRNAVNRNPRWASDGKWLAYESGESPNQTISVYGLESGKEVTWGGGRPGLMRPVWFSRGQFLKTILNEDDAAKELPPHIGDEPYLAAVGIVEKSDRRSTDLFVVTRDYTIPFPAWTLDTPNNDYDEWAVEPSPGDRAVVYESNDGGDRELMISIRNDVFDISNHRATDQNPVWSPDGNWIAFESFRGGRMGIYRVHRNTNRVFPIRQAPKADYGSPSWSPGGRWLVLVTNESGEDRLAISDRDGKEYVPLRIEAVNPAEPAWRPAK